MGKTTTKEIRFQRFDELIARYAGSPKTFCEQTGYDNPTIISQLKGRKRSFGPELARQLEEAAGLPKYALENPDGLSAPLRVSHASPQDWPFSFTLDEYLSLSRSVRESIDDAVSNMVVGAQTKQLIDKPKARRRG